MFSWWLNRHPAIGVIVRNRINKRHIERIKRRLLGTLLKKSRRQNVLRTLLERQGWKCKYCPMELTLETVTIDHVIPQAAALQMNQPELIRDIENLAAACEPCNKRKGAKRAVPPTPIKAEQMVALQKLKQELKGA